MREKVINYISKSKSAIKLKYIAEKSDVAYEKVYGVANSIPGRYLTNEEIGRIHAQLEVLFNYSN